MTRLLGFLLCAVNEILQEDIKMHIVSFSYVLCILCVNILFLHSKIVFTLLF